MDMNCLKSVKCKMFFVITMFSGALAFFTTVMKAHSFEDVLRFRSDLKSITRFGEKVYAIAGNNIIVSVDKNAFTELCDGTCEESLTPNLDFLQTTTLRGLSAIEDGAGRLGVAALVEFNGAHQIYFAPTVGTGTEPQVLIFDTTPYTPSIPLALKAVPFSNSFTSSTDSITRIHSLRRRNLIFANHDKFFLTTKEGIIFELDIAPTGTHLNFVTALPYNVDSFTLHSNYGFK